MSGLNEADTRAKFIDPAIHKVGWTDQSAGKPSDLRRETKTRMFAA